MATAKQILEIIEFAAQNARKRCPTNERDRIDIFICYLSGALQNKGAKADVVSELVFGLLKDDPMPTEGA